MLRLRPAATPRALLIALLCLLVPVACRAPGAPDGSTPEPTAPVTVVAVRHAEKAAPTGDPELNDAGRRRAEALARLFGAEGAVTHLFASQYRRTLETLEPLAAVQGLAIERYDAQDQAGLVARLDALPPGSVAVVAGHSNTLPPLVEALGGAVPDTVDSPYGRILAEDAHDRVFVVVRAATPTAFELRYGD
jgi:phosphohistidine phosphatase SixA